MRKPMKAQIKEEEDFINKASEDDENLGPENVGSGAKINPKSPESPEELATSPVVSPAPGTGAKEGTGAGEDKESASKKAGTKLSLPLPMALLNRLKDEAWRRRTSQSQLLRDLIDKNCK